MALALNLLALVIVVGLCWLGMIWMAGRLPARDDEPGGDLEDLFGRPTDAPEPCTECNGVGAQQRLGRLEPCAVCEGTGVNSASF